MPPQPRPNPATLDPDRDAKVAALIREWIGIAEPPENATIGAQLHYTEWGVMVGTVPGGLIEARAKPDAAAGKSPEGYCWSIRTSLDSVDHGTLEEYVLARLNGDSLARFRGRYKRNPSVQVADFRDRPAALAKRQALLAGFKVAVSLGKVADSVGKAFTVESQEPAAGQRLAVGSELRFKIRQKPSVVPNLLLMPARDALNKLREAGLEARMSIDESAPTNREVNLVCRQEPKRETVVAPGSIVRVYIYGPVSTARNVPDCRKLALTQAIEKLRQAGLKAQPTLEGAAPTQEEQNQVWKQDPLAGANVIPETVVRLYAYGPMKTARTVPDCRRLPLAKALLSLRESGLKAHPVIEGTAPAKEQEHSVFRQEPAPGTEVIPESVVALYVYAPIPNVLLVPDCRRVSLPHALLTLRKAGLKAIPTLEGNAPTQGLEGQVWKQDPDPGVEVVPDATVRLYAYRRAVLTVPDCRRLNTTQAIERLQQIGLKAESALEGSATRPDQENQVWKQEPAPGSRVASETTVRLFAYGQAILKVPDCQRLTLAEAIQRVEQSGLTSQVVERRQAPSAAEADRVWKQEPAAGTAIQPGSTVQFWAYGAAQVLVQVPDCRGLTSEDAVDRLRRGGLKANPRITTASRPPTQDQAGRVYHQVPAAGTEVQPGYTVQIVAYAAARPVPIAVQPEPKRPIPQPRVPAKPYYVTFQISMPMLTAAAKGRRPKRGTGESREAYQARRTAFVRSLTAHDFQVEALDLKKGLMFPQVCSGALQRYPRESFQPGAKFACAVNASGVSDGQPVDMRGALLLTVLGTHDELRDVLDRFPDLRKERELPDYRFADAAGTFVHAQGGVRATVGPLTPGWQENDHKQAVELSKAVLGMIDCFVATAVYRNPLAPEVQVLRRFRDRVLLHSRSGQHLVQLYYIHGPGWAAFVEKRPWLSDLTRQVLDGLVHGLEHADWEDPMARALLDIVLAGADGLAARILDGAHRNVGPLRTTLLPALIEDHVRRTPLEPREDARGSLITKERE